MGVRRSLVAAIAGAPAFSSSGAASCAATGNVGCAAGGVPRAGTVNRVIAVIGTGPVVMVAFVPAGCSAPAGPGGASATPDPVFAEHLAQAEAGAAGERQVEVLRDAARTGQLTFEAVNELVQASFACMTEAGIGHEEWEPFEVVPGYQWPAYSWQTTLAGMSDEQATAIGDACLYEHSYYAEMALQDRRNYADLLDAQMRRDLPEILGCLEENGVPVEPDATLDEIRQAAIELGGETTAISEEDAVWCYEQMPEVWQD